MLDELLDPRPESYKRFLVEWHGRWRDEYGRPLGEAERPMPVPLRDFYEVAGHWPGLTAINHVLLPFEAWTEDDKLVFYVENQWVDIWATVSADTDDAPVWVRENEPGKPWLEEERLSRFLLQVVVFETIMGAAEWAAAPCIPLAVAERLSGRLHELPLAPWHWPVYPTRFYADEDLVVVVNPNPGPEEKPYVSLYAGARERDALLVFADDVGDDSWDHFSPRDGARERPGPT